MTVFPCTVDACWDGECKHDPDDLLCGPNTDCTTWFCDPVEGCVEVEDPTCPPECGENCLKGPVVTDDTFLALSGSAGPEANQGSSDVIEVGEMAWTDFWRTRALLRFDLSSLPVGAVVTGASMTLYVKSTCAAGPDGVDPDDCDSLDEPWELTFHELRRPWVELEATWTGPEIGEEWGQPGADDSVVDHDPGVSATLQVDPSSVDTYASVDVTSSVQAFTGGGVDNYGWLLLGPEVPSLESRTVHFYSSDLEEAVKWPQLVVDYEVP